MARVERVNTVVASAPGRVNLIGEHTDYNGGLCLPFALPLAARATVTRRDDDLLLVRSSTFATPWEGSLADLMPGRVTGWAAYVAGVLWVLREEGWDLPGLDIGLDSAVPLGAGLSSSAALECAVGVGVAGLLGRTVDDELRPLLAEMCRRAETAYVGAPTGGLDQRASMLCTADHALLIDFRDGRTEPVPLPLADAGLCILVTDTRVSHSLADEDGGYAGRRAECERAATVLGVPTLREAEPDAVAALDEAVLRQRARHVVSENARVEAAVTALRAGDWAALGRLMTASHASLRDDFAVSTPELDGAVDTALASGALGARMTGGGFGGSTIALLADSDVARTVTAIDSTARRQGWPEPRHHVVRPADGGRVVSVR
jgi:galactokinase